ncbi:MAG: alpha/beta fold hydrolase [Actinomycetota bacterium]|nr:alpha/beta fold hydrolase [Actinomycetota bacterium]
MAPALHRALDRRERQRLVLVHGFTQTLRSWDAITAPLAGMSEVVRVDLPGHGGSSQVDLDFVATAAAIGDAGGTATYVGYSMGGRLSLRLAVDRPDRVRALVLIGASPGLADDGERAGRRASDEALAAEIEGSSTASFLQRWLAQPMFSGLRPEPADLEARLANRPAGLATALRRLGTGAQEPLWDRLGELSMPVLAVTGREDAKFATVAEEMVGAIGANAEAVTLAGAGHAAHLERPRSFCQLLAAFLVSHSLTS